MYTSSSSFMTIFSEVTTFINIFSIWVIIRHMSKNEREFVMKVASFLVDYMDFYPIALFRSDILS